ncbi:hypothetical protein G6F31_014293 [Rhizopus arrhizus]|nr:hypothetical protein G6F31_014293 [Rhizopus arrhizus]
MHLAAERGYKGFLELRERYWAALSEAEQVQAVTEGEAVYARFGDAAAEPRLALAMRREQKRMTGSRTGFAGNPLLGSRAVPPVAGHHLVDAAGGTCRRRQRDTAACGNRPPVPHSGGGSAAGCPGAEDRRCSAAPDPGTTLTRLPARAGAASVPILPGCCPTGACTGTLAKRHDLRHPCGAGWRRIVRPTAALRPFPDSLGLEAIQVTRTPKIVLLPLAVSAALVGCGKTEAPAKDATASTPAPAQATQYTLDESKLPAYNAFQPSDLDTSKDACGAFGDYVNSKWLAANEIPGDRTSWGAFTILDERSVAVQHQLAEQVAQVKNPNHIEKIVGDLPT